MKLLYFKIGENARFRSLYPGFEIRFRQPDETNEQTLAEFSPFCFAGLNGRGKSNVMEALATLFFHLECCVARFLPASFDAFRPESCSVDAFEVGYLIQRNNGTRSLRNFDRIRVVKHAGKAPQMFRSSYDDATTEQPVSLRPVKDAGGVIRSAAEGKLYLPDIIVGYSSGENEILSIPFHKSRLINFDKYREDFVGGRAFEMPENSLIYIDAGMSQAVLLACLLFEEPGTTLEPFKRILRIRDILGFRIRLNLHRTTARNGERQPLTEHVGEYVEFLKECALSHYETPADEAGNPGTLTLDFHVDATTRRLFRERFGNGFALFRFLQVLYELNCHFIPERIKRSIYSAQEVLTQDRLPEGSPEQQVFRFLEFLVLKESDDGQSTYPLLLKEFSDGEHQFIHTMGICLMLREQRSLLLLDEPETHFNPEWRSKFIGMLERALAACDDNSLLQEILITSHSPFIVSDCRPANVIVFRQDAQGRPVAIKASDLNIATYGTSVNLLTAQLFEERQTIGDYALQRIAHYRKLLLEGKPLGELLDEINREMGDSIEKLMLINEFAE